MEERSRKQMRLSLFFSSFLRVLEPIWKIALRYVMQSYTHKPQSHGANATSRVWERREVAEGEHTATCQRPFSDRCQGSSKGYECRWVAGEKELRVRTAKRSETRVLDERKKDGGYL